MEQKNSTNKPTKIVRYPLASAGRRLATKILDIILVSLIVFGLGCAILMTSPGFKASDLTTIQPWRYTLLAVIGVVIFFVYFLLIPYFTKKTLFMKVLKLQYVNNLPLSNFFFGLFKHELLIWGIISILSLIVGIVLGALTSTSAAEMIKGMTFGKIIDSSDNTAAFYAGAGFAAAYIVAFLVMVAVIIGLFVRNRKPAFHDKFSNVYVIHLRQINTPDKQHNTKNRIKTKVNYGVPGEISSGAFEEIDEL